MSALWSLFLGAVTGWLFSLFVGLRTDLPLSASLNTVAGAVVALLGRWAWALYGAPADQGTAAWWWVNMLAPVGAALLLLGLLTFVRARQRA